MSFNDAMLPAGGAPFRRRVTVCAIIFALGLAGWIACALWGDAPRAWRALLINFLFFTPMSLGLVVWPAVVIVSRGRWDRAFAPAALGAVALAPLSLAAFAALWAGHANWAAWVHMQNLPQGAWLQPTFLFARDGACLLGLWALAIWFVRRFWRGERRTLPGWLIFAYCMVFSLIAFDMVMALDPVWFSTLFGIYFFVTGMYAAAAAWLLIALVRRLAGDHEQLADLAGLTLTFALLSTYMMFSQLLVIWYGNLSHEARFVVTRLHGPEWKWISAALLLMVYLGPLPLLLRSRAKRTPWFLGLVAIMVLAGLWLERWWLVTPTLGGRPVLGLTELSLTAAFAAAMVLGLSLFARRMPFARAGEAAQP